MKTNRELGNTEGFIRIELGKPKEEISRAYLEYYFWLRRYLKRRA